VRIDKGSDRYGLEGEVYLAEVRILDGQRKAAGIGRSELEAVTNLASWLAGAARDIDLEYSDPEGAR
jgi:hypothetical protein